MKLDVVKDLPEQLSWHWTNQLRPRLEGLTDEEYFWEPVAGCWSVRPAGTSNAPRSIGAGDFRSDDGWPPPSPAPVTTIAWRLGHIISGVLGQRAASHFGAPDMSPATHAYAGTAARALRQLDDAYRHWIDGVAALDEAGLNRPCGPAEGPFADFPLGALVLHVNRETIHHGAEIALLRDLYRHRFAVTG